MGNICPCLLSGETQAEYQPIAQTDVINSRSNNNATETPKSIEPMAASRKSPAAVSPAATQPVEIPVVFIAISYF